MSDTSSDKCVSMKVINSAIKSSLDELRSSSISGKQGSPLPSILSCCNYPQSLPRIFFIFTPVIQTANHKQKKHKTKKLSEDNIHVRFKTCPP